MQRKITEHSDQNYLFLLWDETVYKKTIASPITINYGKYRFVLDNKSERIVDNTGRKIVDINCYKFLYIIHTLEYNFVFDFGLSDGEIEKTYKKGRMRHGNVISWNKTFQLKHIENYVLDFLNYTIIFDLNVTLTLLSFSHSSKKRKAFELLYDSRGKNNFTYSDLIPLLEEGYLVTRDKEGKFVLLTRSIGGKITGIYEPCKNNQKNLSVEGLCPKCSKVHREILSEESYQYYHNEIMKTIENPEYVIKFL